MDMTYDNVADALYIHLTREKATESNEASPGIIIDYSERGDVVGIEIFDVSKRPGLDVNVLVKLDADQIVR